MSRLGIYGAAVVAAVGLCLAVPARGAAQGSYKVTKWDVRYYYVNGRTNVDERDFDSKEDAEAAAEKFKAANNNPGVSYPRDYVARYEAFPVEVTITPPRPARPQQEPYVPVPQRPAVTPPPAPRPADALTGTTWIGSETLQGYGRLEFRFLANNRVQMIDARTRRPVPGSWYASADGRSVSLIFYGGNCTYSGTLAGGQLSGRALAGRRQFTWRTSRAGGT